jgi:hypothetical protein
MRNIWTTSAPFAVYRQAHQNHHGPPAMTEFDDLMDQLCELYEKGHKPALAVGLAYCIKDNRPIPPWLATAFGEACKKIASHEIESWDCVFGEPVLKGQRLHTLRRNSRIRKPLWRRVQERRAAGAAITKELFAEVGAEFGLSATVAADIYYDSKVLKVFWQKEGTSGKV